ncbi:hypothetical protein MIND_01350900 [Mycena indigotica]|uniref:RRM domain-containing protein n=1 Tax=Mycena indigotica TaxID=2126181 RepID=A0A8H6S034_9AGAR|nr:uncharacterized protein MIND_01350900 [Mycena indigotica]KAF7289770.1 hypothetical protein MIND_01350900 [Mycena indigotica]
MSRSSCAPPTPPPVDSADIAVQAQLPTIPTSVSSPAWFPSVDSPLVPSSSTATLVDDVSLSPLEKGKATFDPSVHEIKVGKIVEALDAMDVNQLDVTSTDLEPGEIAADTSSRRSLDSSLPPLPASPVSSARTTPEFASTLTSKAASVDPATTTPLPISPPRVSPTDQPQSSPSFAPHLPEPVEKTPNVYINGLPPNFPEDQLFQLAVPFGTVRSVRSFTRHVGDTETGYGFVLFDTIASAERCINSLRRYRNLHPTFSKQVHKIPGTIYAHTRNAPASQVTSASASSRDGNSSLHGWEQEEGSTSGDSTFKARMERLSDKSSTNLYIEGLPLSIDEVTLAALVSPYSIRSSRFFQTRLSNPPRIIAFVRLETRSAAEEIIERLHGRMVRGWNDPGSRISVRFADTTEQRELRRQERLTREGEGGSSQLSIAQATLLNLRGNDLNRNSNGGYRGNDVSEPATRVPFQYAEYPAVPHSRQFDALDHARVPPRYPQQQIPSYYDGSPAQTQRINPAMASLLESLQAQADYHHISGVPVSNVRPFVPRGQQGLGIGSGGAHAQLGGYTPTEEFILRARSESLPPFSNASLKRRPPPLDLNDGRLHPVEGSGDANIGMGVRGYRTQASTLSFRHGQPLSPVFDAPESSMNEEDFHAQRGDRNHSLHNNNNNNNNNNNSTARMPRNTNSSFSHHAHSAPSHLRAQHHNEFVPRHRQSSLPSNQNHSYQHSHSQQQLHESSSSSNNSTHNNHATTKANHIRVAPHINTNVNSNNNTNPLYGRGQQIVFPNDVEQAQSSPALVSPALTYSSSRSSGFSPTTPFLPSFDEGENPQETDGFGGKKRIEGQHHHQSQQASGPVLTR